MEIPETTKLSQNKRKKTCERTEQKTRTFFCVRKKLSPAQKKVIKSLIN